MSSRAAWADEGWQPKRIAVLRALHLGDLLCATPALRALRQRFPAAEITLIGLPWAEELVRRLPALDRLVPFPGYPGILEAPYDPQRTDAFLAAAREDRYDLAIQMHGSGDSSNGFVASLGAAVTLGYRRDGDTRLTISAPYVADDHEVLRWLRLVGMVGADTSDPRMAFPTTTEEQRRAAALLAQAPPTSGPLVGLHAGGRGLDRRWPAERFAALADALADRWDARIVLTGSDAEREVTQRLREAARTPVLDLAGKTDLGTFAAVIGQLDLLVTNDTGASHLAAASGTASVVIFATTSPYQWAPLDRDRHVVVDARTFAPPEMPGTEAIARLPVEPVLLACEHLLDGVTARAAAAAAR